MADVKWADVAAAGGIREWVDAEIARQGLTDPGVPTDDADKKQYKARRQEERRVRKELYRAAWLAYKRAHVVHLGPGVWWHDTADVDRFDADDPDKRRTDNALPDFKDVDAFAKAVGLTIPRLRWLAYHREVDSGTHYHRWTVPKRDGTPRLISAPKPELKAAQRWIMREVTEHLPVHGAAHGFLARRSITVTNAQVHAGAGIVINMDIRGFYPTVTFRRVKGLLRRAGLTEQVATLMALLATESPREEVVTHGKTYYVATGPRSLPQGAPTSPSITNALCLRLDCRLSGLARKLGARYTRYSADRHDVQFCLQARRHRHAAQVGQRDRQGRGLHGPPEEDARDAQRRAAEGHLRGLVVQRGRAPEQPTARVPRTTVRQAARGDQEPRARSTGQGRDVATAQGHGGVRDERRPRARPAADGSHRRLDPRARHLGDSR